MNKIITGISMDRELIKLIDERRGLIPRSTFVSKIIRKEMEAKN
jgi:metal-responsive CopG/Arc/MetJ family transcriptional regulator